ncbi:MAG: caspase family protein [bacterium]
MAGHGAKDKSDHFYFLTSEGSREHPKQGGIDWAILGKPLARIPGRVILFLDACRSGGLVTETVVPNDELARRLFSRGGGVMVFSASKGWQGSMESPDIEGGVGVFTYALTRGLGPEAKTADANGNGFVEFMELVDYVRVTVDRGDWEKDEVAREKLKGHQTPWLSRKELFGDLPIARVN